MYGDAKGNTVTKYFNNFYAVYMHTYHIEQGARDILGSDLGVHCDRVRLGQLPPGPDVDDGLYYTVTVIVDEAEGSTLIGDGQCELVVIHQTHLQLTKATIAVWQDRLS